MKRQQIEAFYNYFTMTQEQLSKKLQHMLKETYHYKDVLATDDFIIAFGSIPVALVAHMDTVFSEPPVQFFFDSKEQILWSPQGLGADDRAGIIMIITLLDEGYRPTIIFTADEEMGGLGAETLTELVPKEVMTKYVKFFIELDRQGEDDCVFYESGNKDFHKYIETFGFKTAEGIFSDISLLCPFYSIEGVNLSTGGYEPHTYTEFLDFRDWEKTLNRVRVILSEPSFPLYSYYERAYVFCMGCGKRMYKEKINEFHSWNHYLCPRCYAIQNKRGK